MPLDQGAASGLQERGSACSGGGEQQGAVAVEFRMPPKRQLSPQRRRQSGCSASWPALEGKYERHLVNRRTKQVPSGMMCVMSVGGRNSSVARLWMLRLGGVSLIISALAWALLGKKGPLLAVSSFTKVHWRR